MRRNNNHYKLLRFLISTILSLSMVLMPTTLYADSLAEPGTPVDTSQVEDRLQIENPCALTRDHIRYVSPDKYGRFRPAAKLTKGQAASMLYNLLAVKPENRTYCKDVTEHTSYSKAISSLLYLEVISPDSTGCYYPGKNITMAQFQKMIAKCLGEEGTFTSNSTVSRGQAVKYLNQKLGRNHTDKDTIKSGKNIRVFTDVPYGSTYYYDVMEASIGHTCSIENGAEVWNDYTAEATGITGTGWKIIDGETYYISVKTKLIQRNRTIDGKKLNASGRYTTGDAKLDALMKKIIKDNTTNDMTNKAKLKKCYKYVYQKCKYRADVKRKIGTSSWDRSLAYKMLKNHKGNCYYYAAAMTYLARKCGYDAKTISGYIYYIPANSYFRHGWTEITLSDGSKRVCDTEIQYLNYIDNGKNDYFYRTYNTTVKKCHYYYYNMGKRCR